MATRKSELIRVRVTPEEKKEIERIAHERGLSTSEFLRAVGVASDQKAKTPLTHESVTIPVGPVGNIGGKRHFTPDPK